jgi:hypothetical protein
MIQISVANAIVIFLAVMGMIAGFGRILVAQFDKRMTEQLKAQDTLRTEQISNLNRQMSDAAEQVKRLVGKVEDLNTTLPMEYVRREDWILFGAGFDKKLDSLGKMLFQLTGEPRARG